MQWLQRQSTTNGTPSVRVSTVWWDHVGGSASSSVAAYEFEDILPRLPRVPVKPVVVS
jgi:hypothetical protein